VNKERVLMNKVIKVLVILIAFVLILPNLQAEEHSKTTDTQHGRDFQTLDDMLAAIKDKELQEKRLEELRRGKEAGEQNRLSEIERLRKEQAAIEEDVRKYEEIVSSEYGSEMREAAWKNLVSRYPEARNLAVGDINGLKRKLYPKPILRSSFKKLSVSQAQSIPHITIHENTDWGFYGYSTIQNNYESKTINSFCTGIPKRNNSRMLCIV